MLHRDDDVRVHLCRVRHDLYRHVRVRDDRDFLKIKICQHRLKQELLYLYFVQFQ